jgi:t-SNARE complex subunit (syntaxin)
VLNESAAKFLSQINHTLQVEITTAALSAKDAQRDLPLADPDATNEPRRDVTRIIDPAQEAQNADTERQLSEALRGLENEKAA